MDSATRPRPSAGVRHLEPARQRRNARNALHDQLVITATAAVGALASLGQHPGAVADGEELARQLAFACRALNEAVALSQKDPHLCPL